VKLLVEIGYGYEQATKHRGKATQGAFGLNRPPHERAYNEAVEETP